MAMDFPNSPVMGQVYTSGAVSYIWNGYAWDNMGSGTGESGDYVKKTGDTMSGFLTLNADPTAALHAATKSYVDGESALPGGGTAGQALVINSTGVATWGAPIEGGTF